MIAITALHLFESAPQSKCAVAYEVVSPREEIGIVYLIVVYSVTANQVLRIMKSESEVTKICTPADDQILIAGTNVGSLVLYDLTAFESSAIGGDFFDYDLLLFKKMQEGMGEDDDVNHEKALKQYKAKYKVLRHTFATDLMENYKHYSPICQLEFVNKVGNANA